jgi:translation initiation factor 2B subunit (eIF-2B alpha/beta/delta family)
VSNTIVAQRKQGMIATNRRSAFDVRLQLLRNDHTSPSLALAHQAIDLTEDWIEAGLHPKRLALEFHAMHPRLALVANLARMIEEEDPGILDSLRLLRASLREGNRRIAETFAKLCTPNPTIITLSNSATVCDALVHIGTRAVYVVDARPGSESPQMAAQLRRRLTPSESGPAAEVHLIEAATIGNIVPRVDCAVVGTDAISRSGAVLHKVGTLPLALCCRHFGKPLYALGHSLKQVDHELEEPPPPHSLPETRVFDVTPAQLVTALVTERTESFYATRSAT